MGIDVLANLVRCEKERSASKFAPTKKDASPLTDELQLFIVVQCKANVILFETPLHEKARLARSFPNVLRASGAETFAARGERPLAPASPVAIDGPRCQIVTDASLSQLIAYFQGTHSACCALKDEILCESLVGQEILALERVQDFADDRLPKASQSELTAKLGARVLAARE